MPIRLHLDEQIGPAVGTALRSRGIDVTTTHETDLLGASDQVQLDYCRANERVLVTYDTDFLIIASQGAEHSGIIFGRQGQFSIGELIRHLSVAAFCLSVDEMKDHVEFL